MSETKQGKPNCYECKWRRECAGSAHSSCGHPDAGSGDAMGNILAMFASVRRTLPHVNLDGAKKLNIAGNPHGISHGWFNWPYNFDPTWLEHCDGFEAKAEGTQP